MPYNATTLTEKILDTLHTVLPRDNVGIPLHEPTFTQDEVLMTKECVESGWVSYRSQFVDRFEKELADYLGVQHVISTVNGTAALHIALLALGIQPQEEILIPSLTFAATANAVSYCGATPHFVDSCEEDFGVNVEKLDNYLQKITNLNKDGHLINRITGRRIRAIIPVHVFGHPVDMDALNAVADRYKLLVIEDAAESLGSLYKNRHTGTFGQIAITSFNGNKIITTGGGGAVLVNDAILAEKVRHLSTTAKQAHPWEFWHDEVGYNYRLAGINAALGCAQMNKIREFLEKKRTLAFQYKEAFSSIEEMKWINEPKACKSNFWLNAILLDNSIKAYKNDILAYLNNHKIFCRGVWVPMHKLPAFQNCPRMDLSITENLYDRIINLPSSPSLVS